MLIFQSFSTESISSKPIYIDFILNRMSNPNAHAHATALALLIGRELVLLRGVAMDVTVMTRILDTINVEDLNSVESVSASCSFSVYDN